MKKILFLFLLTYGFSNAQIVNIPDANFKNKLVNTLCVDTDGDGYGDINVDTNNDGEIQISEAEAVLNLNLYFPNFTPISEQISDLTGINSFINLEILDCTNNNLVSLDVSGLPNLKTMNCMNNHVSTLNVNGLIHLEYLSCDYNQISVLNLAGLSNLKSLSCYNNQLSALNLTGLTNLISLECSNNNITSLNLSPTPNLIGLRCSDNLLNTLNVNFLTSLTLLEYGNLGLNNVAINNLVNLHELLIAGGIQNAIDLTPLVGLNSLRLTNTNFIQIDVSSLQYLNRFYAYSNYSLNYVNMKNGNHFNPADFGNGVYLQTNPNLTFICADEKNIVYINEQLATENNTTTQVNSYCNFTPGGDYNTIVGQVQFDENNNGCDADDDIKSFIRFDVNDGTETGSTVTNINGTYNFFTDIGTFEITPNIENSTWFAFSPPSSTFTFTDNNNNIATQNFCIAAVGSHQDIEVVLAPLAPARPGFDATYKVVYKNKGNQMVSGAVNLIFDDAKTDLISAEPSVDVIGTNSLTWNYENLMPFENRSIVIKLNVNGPMETPAVNIGDILEFTASITPVVADELPLDNQFAFSQTVVGSFDPNDIVCIQGDNLSPSEIGNYLHYIVNFENTGTAPAENVVVKIEIDETKYDLSSLQLLNGSHPVEARVNNNIAEFIFKSIELETNGHGNILLKVRSKTSLNDGDTVTKKANIFFDYNFPILTNDANTTFQDLSIDEHLMDNSISIYPNPSRDVVNIEASSTINSVQVYDMQGRLLLTHLANDSKTNIDISDKADGVYFFKINSDKGIKVEKIIKK